MSDTTTAWMRSSFCNSGACIEVALIGDSVQLRDSKNTDLPAVVFTPDEWTGFQDLVLAFGKTA